jgi:thiol-disulfide isomerase/thioredoxin
MAARIRAPEFPADFDWIGTPRPLRLAELRGHVVILDFWTYCCINCMHTLPVLAALEEKRRQEPVVVIGVHSAKFDAEGDAARIREAMARHGVGPSRGRRRRAASRPALLALSSEGVAHAGRQGPRWDHMGPAEDRLDVVDAGSVEGVQQISLNR